MLQKIRQFFAKPHQCCVCGKRLKKIEGYKSFDRAWDGMYFQWLEVTCKKHAS